MRYAHDNFGSPPIGVEPQPSRMNIIIQSYEDADAIYVRDRNQCEQVIALLMDAAEIMGWDV